MRALLLLSTVTVTLAAGCASPQEIERSAIKHDQRAAYYESYGDYHRAQKQRHKADKDREKATDRAEWYNNWYTVY